MVQSSAYGEAIPFVFGRMRVAGNVIWSSGIDEQVDSAGGGKGGPATNQYSYSSSFAVGLTARHIAGIGRIWADGRMIRDGDGVWSLPVQMRLHLGSEQQLPDPLIAAAEGDGLAPAYRGLAYAVFEDLPLADFGNRIPNLSFEVIADDGAAGLDFAGAAAGLAAQAGDKGIALGAEGGFPELSGFVAARAGSLGTNLAPIVEALGIAVSDDDGALTLRRVADPAAFAPGITGLELDAVIDCQARPVSGGDGLDERTPADRQTLAGGEQADSLEIGHYAADRDYLAGLQRVRRSAGQRVEQLVLPVAMAAGRAKALAAELLVQRRAGRLTRVLRLPWRFVALTPGTLVRVSDLRRYGG
ncbi:MAG: phage tail protein [Polymorphobacter sp.]|uniref:phage tail protein n=1 Tax=Polymorphobacter sp. TaxID=1909290 RepID=UPI003A84B647